MDAEFEQHYQAAERAYGLGDYTEAHALASALWDQLQSASDEHDPSLVLGWRAVVALLLGHIQLHGLQQPDQAALFYQRVLDSEPEATLAALAEQGLEHCRSENTVSPATTTPANGGGDGGSGGGAIPDLLKDPFLTTDPDQTRPVQANVVTAMPWLPSEEQPRPTPAPAPTQEPEAKPEPDITTEQTEEPPSDVVEDVVEVEAMPQEPAVSLEPDITTEPTEQSASDVLEDEVEVEPTLQEPAAIPEPDITTEQTEEPPNDDIEDEVEVEPTLQEPAAKDLLEQSWLRRQLQPGMKRPTDSPEPMGLINRIKGAFARSAGR